MADSANWLERFNAIARPALILAIVSLNSACQDESTSGNQFVAASGTSTVVSSTTTSGGNTTSVNRAPTITGQPSTEILVGARFDFTPIGTDPDGDALRYSVVNLPNWASFNADTGAISGKPEATHVGTYYNVVVSVTDGKATTSLKSFSLAVTQVASGSVALSWMPPTENTDGSALVNLAGYKIHYGKSADGLDQVVTVPSSGVTAYVVQNLTSGYWYFSLRAYTSNGVESDLSAVVGTMI